MYIMILVCLVSHKLDSKQGKIIVDIAGLHRLSEALAAVLKDDAKVEKRTEYANSV